MPFHQHRFQVGFKRPDHFHRPTGNTNGRGRVIGHHDRQSEKRRLDEAVFGEAGIVANAS
jgi:hypothetical protein